MVSTTSDDKPADDDTPFARPIRPVRSDPVRFGDLNPGRRVTANLFLAFLTRQPAIMECGS